MPKLSILNFIVIICLFIFAGVKKYLKGLVRLRTKMIVKKTKSVRLFTKKNVKQFLKSSVVM